MKIALSTLFMMFSIVSTFAQTAPPIEAGVSQTLAKWRAANYSDVRYKLNITLEKGAPLMKGDIEIRVNLSETGAKNDLILDWRTTQFQNDKDKPYARIVQVNTAADFLSSETNEHIIIPKQVLKTGENFIKLSFASPIKTSGAAITRYVDKEDGAEYVYSLFVPSDASTAFPVFDQPDLKARFQLTIDTPSDVHAPYKWKTVSNTLPDGYSITFGNLHDTVREQRLITRFKETKPISTYVFAFAAGEFAEFQENQFNKSSVKSSNINISPPPSQIKTLERPDEFLNLNSKIYVRKSQAEKFKQHATEVFRLNREGVRFLESWFDYKFPFPKYDLVLIPEFPFGGMEHAGATFLREDRVIFPTEPTKNDYITRANVIFHEAAHQWFGDTVTMKWFDDLWLKEGFAEFMAYKTLEKVMPEYNAWKIFYERNKQAAYLTDSTRGTTPIYQEIPNLSAAKSAYGNIVYRKAPSFLRQAEFYLGEDKFQTAVRAFLKKHEFANAEWTDLVKEFETASGNDEGDLNAWATAWVKRPGVSKIRLRVSNYKSKPTEKFLTTEFFHDEKEADTSVVKFKVLLINKDGKRLFKDYLYFNSSRKRVEGDAFTLNEIPTFIFPNYQDYGYGIFLLDEESRAYVLENIQTEKDDFLRTMMWGALWDSVRETELAPADYVALVIKNLSRPENLQASVASPNDSPHKSEQDETTLSAILARVSTAMNYYLSDAQRAELAPQLESELVDRMASSETAGQQIVFFRAFVNAASSEPSKLTLKMLLNGTVRIKNINLKTKDKFDIVTRLLILGDKDAPRLLAELEKSETSDEARRYAYAARAGFPTTENAAKYFNDFINNKDISESYVESAIVPFNSPRNADLTLPYLQKALAELPNLKRNRKIFFVNSWLAAFIGGQKSEQALAIVNKFLADNPNLDKDLRLKVLEASDGLERAVKVRKKFSGAN